MHLAARQHLLPEQRVDPPSDRRLLLAARHAVHLRRIDEVALSTAGNAQRCGDVLDDAEQDDIAGADDVAARATDSGATLEEITVDASRAMKRVQEQLTDARHDLRRAIKDKAIALLRVPMLEERVESLETERTSEENR